MAPRLPLNEPHRRGFRAAGELDRNGWLGLHMVADETEVRAMKGDRWEGAAYIFMVAMQSVKRSWSAGRWRRLMEAVGERRRRRSDK